LVSVIVVAFDVSVQAYLTKVRDCRSGGVPSG
jgi:hypothetical protein